MSSNQYRVLNLISVSSDSISHNLKYFSDHHSECSIAPVLKSNAYGHGLTNIGRLLDNNNFPMFCVDSLYEAYELYKSGTKTPILIMGYTNPTNYQIKKKLPFIFGVYDLTSLRMLGKYQPKALIHIKIDSGMCRLGLQKDGIAQFISELRKYPSLQIEGIYSHLSQADAPKGKNFTNKQINIFKQSIQIFENAGFNFKWKHISATSGSEFIHDPYFNLIRLGIGMYGYSPFGPHTKEGRRQRKHLRPALTLTSTIASIKNLNPGEQVGYGGTHTAKQKERIAILPLGYNEGISRLHSNRGEVMINNTSCPIVGNVSMNMTTVKLTRNSDARQGDKVILISPNANSSCSAYKLASLCQTIPYEILTSLHASIRREIIISSPISANI